MLKKDVVISPCERNATWRSASFFRFAESVPTRPARHFFRTFICRYYISKVRLLVIGRIVIGVEWQVFGQDFFWPESCYAATHDNVGGQETNQKRRGESMRVQVASSDRLHDLVVRKLDPKYRVIHVDFQSYRRPNILIRFLDMGNFEHCNCGKPVSKVFVRASSVGDDQDCSTIDYFIFTVCTHRHCDYAQPWLPALP